MKKTSFTAAALLAMALAACQQTTTNDTAVDANNLESADVETLPPSDSNAPAPADNATTNDTTNEADDGGSEPAATVIPAQYQGRWGMVAADCTSTRGDAKGLITLGDKTIRFYESTATLKEQRPAIATSFAGLFGFAGEGQTWEKVVTLTRTGDTLKRADDEGTYNYTRCKA